MLSDDDDDAFRAALAFVDDFDGISEPDPALHEGVSAHHHHQYELGISLGNAALQGPDSVDVHELHGALRSGWIELLGELTPAATVTGEEIALTLDVLPRERCGDRMTLATPSSDPPAVGAHDAASKEAAERALKRVKTTSSNGNNARTSSGYEPVRKHDPNKARNERKQELIFLKSKVAELEATLCALQLKKKSEADGSCSLCVDGASRCHRHRERHLHNIIVPQHVVKRSHPGNDPISRVWQEIADRQRTLREKAERENIRLKLVLASQLKVAKSLESFFHKPSNRAIQEIGKCLDAMHYRPESGHFAQATGFTPAPSDAAVFDALLAGVQRCYDEIDTVFAANGLARIETTYTDARMRRGRISTENANSSGLHLDITATKLLPFDLEAASEAVWHHFVFGKEKNPHRYYSEQTPKVFFPAISSYIKNFGLEVHDASGTSAEFRVKQVLRQYRDADRIVIVWQARLDAVAFCNAPLPMIHDGEGFFEKGYILLRRPQTSSLANKGITMMQTCFDITPTFASRSCHSGSRYSGLKHADDTDEASLNALTEFVLSATTANLRISHQIIENVVLEQSLTR